MSSKAKNAIAALAIPQNILLILFAVILCFAAAVLCAGNVYVGEERIYKGTEINGIDIGGMTFEEAEAAVGAACSEQLDSTMVPIAIDGKETVISAKEMGGSIDFASAIAGTFYDANNGDVSYRWDAIMYPVSGSTITADVSINESVVEQVLADRLDQYNVAPKDATVSFDADTKTFSYTDEANGRVVDIEATSKAAMESVTQALLTGEPVQTVGAVCHPVEPQVRSEDLRANTVLIGSCVTKATRNENRNTNIRLMCQAIDGYEILPGAVLSINEHVGERTEAKGFKEAGAIVHGDIVDAVGGGICQLAGTLYNAALQANMEIVERRRHTYPSDYLPVGLDATLHWNTKDLKLGNNTAYPIYISAKLDEEERTVTVELYGQPLPENETILIEADVLRETRPEGPIVIYTTDLPEGERKVLQPELIGYEVVVYRKHFVDGELAATETISRNTYNTRQEKVMVGISEEESK